MSVRSIFEGGNVKSIPNIDAAGPGNVLGVVSTDVEGVHALGWLNIGGTPGGVSEVNGTAGKITATTNAQGVCSLDIPISFNLTQTGQSMTIGNFQVIEEGGDTTASVTNPLTGQGVILDTFNGLTVQCDDNGGNYRFPETMPTANQVIKAGSSNVGTLEWYDIPTLAGTTFTTFVTLGLGNTGAIIPLTFVSMGPLKQVVIQFGAMYANPIQNTSGGAVVQFNSSNQFFPDPSIIPDFGNAFTMGYTQYICAQNSPLQGTTAYGMAAISMCPVNNDWAQGFYLQFTLCPSMNGDSNGILNTSGTYHWDNQKFLTLGCIPSNFDTIYDIKTMSSNALFSYY